MARACSRCGHRGRRDDDRIHRRAHHLEGGAAPPPARPDEPNHTFYFHIDDKHVIDANVGGNAARWINHACDPNCEADEVDGRVFIKAAARPRPGRGAVLRLRPGDRRALHGQAEEASTPATAAAPTAAARCWPRRGADAKAPRRWPTADTCTGAPKRCGRSSDALLPGLSVEVVASADSTNTRLLERARLSSGWRDAPVTTPGQLDTTPAAPDPPTPHGRRNDDTQPCLLVAETQTRGRGRQGRAWHSGAGASLTFSLALPLHAAALVGAVAGRGRGAGRRARPAAGRRAAAHRPEVAQRPLADGRARPGPQARRRADRDGGGRRPAHGRGRRRPERAAAATAEEPSTGFACLQELWPESTAPQALAAVAEPLVRALKRFERDGFAAVCRGLPRRDLLCGQPVSTTFRACRKALPKASTSSGALRVRAGAACTRWSAAKSACGRPEMRALVALLLLANLGFLALARGWLQPYVGLPTQHEREPQRLAAQVDPERCACRRAVRRRPRPPPASRPAPSRGAVGSRRGRAGPGGAGAAVRWQRQAVRAARRGRRARCSGCGWSRPTRRCASACRTWSPHAPGGQLARLRRQLAEGLSGAAARAAARNVACGGGQGQQPEAAESAAAAVRRRRCLDQRAGPARQAAAQRRCRGCR